MNKKLKDMIIGIDLDNTIVSYDSLFLEICRERQLVECDDNWNKQQVRDAVREQKGDDTWQYLQAAVYGPQMHRAAPATGVLKAIKSFKDNGATLYIVSHKTACSNIDPSINLHESAKAWLEQNKISGDLIAEDHIFFEPTRDEKIARIRSIGCDLYIDDLQEVFVESSFPTEIFKVLYAANAEFISNKVNMHCRSWEEIEEFVTREYL